MLPFGVRGPSEWVIVHKSVLEDLKKVEKEQDLRSIIVPSIQAGNYKIVLQVQVLFRIY